MVARLNQGLDIAGQPLGAPTRFHVGVAVNPFAPDPDAEWRRLEYKVEAGAEFIVTPPILDVDAFDAVAAALHGHGPAGPCRRRRARERAARRVPRERSRRRARRRRPVRSPARSRRRGRRSAGRHASRSPRAGRPCAGACRSRPFTGRRRRPSGCWRRSCSVCHRSGLSRVRPGRPPRPTWLTEPTAMAARQRPDLPAVSQEPADGRRGHAKRPRARPGHGREPSETRHRRGSSSWARAPARSRARSSIAFGTAGRFLAIDIEPEFVREIHQRFPRVDCVQASAEQTRVTCQGAQHWARRSHPVRPAVRQPPARDDRRILEGIEQTLRPGGTFTAFQYVHAYRLARSKRFRRDMSRRMRHAAGHPSRRPQFPAGVRDDLDGENLSTFA